LHVKRKLVSRCQQGYLGGMSEALRTSEPFGVPFPPREDRFEIFDELFERIADGEAITAIAADAHMPSTSTLFRWMSQDTGAWEAYMRAREIQAHVYASRVITEAHGATDPAIGRLRMDALKWAAGKLAPKVYGDSTQIKHADADGNKLDTAPLVNELLSAMGGASNAPLTLINVTPNQDSAPASGYKPPEERIKLRRAPIVRTAASDVDDLV